MVNMSNATARANEALARRSVAGACAIPVLAAIVPPHDSCGLCVPGPLRRDIRRRDGPRGRARRDTARL